MKITILIFSPARDPNGGGRKRQQTNQSAELETNAASNRLEENLAWATILKIEFGHHLDLLGEGETASKGKSFTIDGVNGCNFFFIKDWWS